MPNPACHRAGRRIKRHQRGRKRGSSLRTCQPKLLAQIRGFLRVKHYSLRTEESYLGWIKRFILFHGKRHPDQLGPDAIRAFLTDLAVRGEVAASTQNQALSALLFLYQQILGRTDMTGLLDGVTPAKRPIKMPIVFTPTEARRVLDQLSGTYRLMGQRFTAVACG